MFEIICHNCKAVVLMDGSDPPTIEDLRRVCEDQKWMHFIHPKGFYKSICPDCDFDKATAEFVNEIPKDAIVNFCVSKPDTSEEWKN